MVILKKIVIFQGLRWGPTFSRWSNFFQGGGGGGPNSNFFIIPYNF